jgi:hypothetical protein
MYKFAFTYLVKEDQKTWSDFLISLELLYKNILKSLACEYKIIIFCEGEPIKKVKNFITYLSKEKNINIHIKKISLQKYVKRKDTDPFIKNFPSAANCKLSTSLGYRDMCKFFAIDVFFDKKLEDVEYFIRLDTDSFFIFTNNKFITDLQKIDCDYGYIKNTIQKEDKAVSLGFGKCLYEFCCKNRANFFKYRKFINICQDATLNPKIFYTNFEIVKLSWARSNEHKKFLKYIVNSKGIYNFRWGDALIRYYTVNLLNASIKELKGCLYKHSGLYDSRNYFQVLLTKSYSKIRNRLYKNIYEKRLSKLDKFFLGVLN